MAINTKLELRQTHNLVMTPQLQQAIKLLQLSNMELASFVEGELERNPLLERDDTDEPNAAASESPQTAAKDEGGEAGERATVPASQALSPATTIGSIWTPETTRAAPTISMPSHKTCSPTRKALPPAR